MKDSKILTVKFLSTSDHMLLNSCTHSMGLTNQLYTTYALLGIRTVPIPIQVDTLPVPVGVQSMDRGRDRVGEGRTGRLGAHTESHISSWYDRDSAMTHTLE